MGRASDRCYGRSSVRFPSGTQSFSLSHARDMMNIPSILIKDVVVVFVSYLLQIPHKKEMDK